MRSRPRVVRAVSGSSVGPRRRRYPPPAVAPRAYAREGVAARRLPAVVRRRRADRASASRSTTRRCPRRPGRCTGSVPVREGGEAVATRDQERVHRDPVGRHGIDRGAVERDGRRDRPAAPTAWTGRSRREALRRPEDSWVSRAPDRAGTAAPGRSRCGPGQRGRVDRVAERLHVVQLAVGDLPRLLTARAGGVERSVRRPPGVHERDHRLGRTGPAAVRPSWRLGHQVAEAGLAAAVLGRLPAWVDRAVGPGDVGGDRADDHVALHGRPGVPGVHDLLDGRVGVPCGRRARWWRGRPRPGSRRRSWS